MAFNAIDSAITRWSSVEALPADSHDHSERTPLWSTSATLD
jgi:hypothetical protein